MGFIHKYLQTNIMNRIMFYNKLDRFKKNLEEKDSLEHRFSDHDGVDNKLDTNGNRPREVHTNEYKGTFNNARRGNLSRATKPKSNYGQSYYTKIDKYYPDGSARYFYSKDEYEVYQNGQVKGNSAKYLDQMVKETAERKAAEAKKKQQEEIYRKNKEADEAKAKAEQEKYAKLHAENNNNQRPKTREEAEKEAIKREQERIRKAEIEANKKPETKALEQAQEELVKLEGKQNLAKNRGLDNKENKKEYDKLAKEIEAKEKEITSIRKKMADETLANRDKEIKEATKREQERIEKEATEKLETWKENIKDNINDYALEVYDNIKRCANDRDVPFNVDNPFVDLFKEALKKYDPDFDGDIAAYVRPYPGQSIAGILGSELLKDDKHTKIAKRVLNELEDNLDKTINKYTVNDEQYDDFLDHLKGKQEKNKTAAIDKEMDNARKSLEAMYNGDEDSINLDKSLKKVLETKLKEIDPEYEKGNLYKYVRPYILGKWWKDDESYAKVTEALNELEKELRSANKHDDAYGDFVEKVSKILA